MRKRTFCGPSKVSDQPAYMCCATAQSDSIFAGCFVDGQETKVSRGGQLSLIRLYTSLQSNFNGSNIFGTMESSRHG